MDPFTERMLERARARREKLDKQLNSVGQPCGKKRTPLHENNPPVLEDSYGDLVSPSKALDPSPSAKRISLSPNKRVTPVRKSSRTSLRKSPRKKATPPPPRSPDPETDTEEEESGFRTAQAPSPSSVEEDPGETEDEKREDSSAPITDGVRSRLRRLGALYSDAEQLSSPIHRTENNFSVEPVSQRSRLKSTMRSARLAALASSINQWEDDLSHPTIAASASRDKAPLPAKSVPRYSTAGVKRKTTDKSKTEVDNSKIHNVDDVTMPSTSPRLPGLKAVRKSGGGSNSALEVTASPRQLQWDKAMLDSLEAQGFCRSDSNSRLTYDFEQENISSCLESEYLQNLEEESPSKKSFGSPMKASSSMGSPARSPLVMGVAQLRKNVSPVKQVSGSPSRTPTSPMKSFARASTKLGNVVDVSQPEGSVLQRAAKYESEAASPPKRLARDPAELPLAERMALFEKNKGPLLVPKVPFSTPMPAKLLQDNDKGKSFAKPASANPCPLMKEPLGGGGMSKLPSKSALSSKLQGEESAVLRRRMLFEAGKARAEDSPSRPQNQAVAERQREMEMLANRWTRNKEIAGDDFTSPVEPSSPAKHKVSPVKATATPPPPPPPMPNAPLSGVSSHPSKSPAWRSPRRAAPKDVYPGVSEVKRIKVSPPKPGHLYPCLSDVEATTETEDMSSANQSLEDDESSIELGTADDSFGKDILEAAEKLQSSYRSTTDSKADTSITESAVLRDMDDFLEDAMGESSDEDQSPTPPKKTRATPTKKSDSFYYKPAPESEPEVTLERKSPRRTSTKYRAPQPPTSSTPSEDEKQVPLMHTVSFYRKQQNMTPKTPLKQVRREDSTSESPTESESCASEEESKLVEVRVRQLLNEVSKQLTVISQASQALNLCNATIEFACSSEEVEAERLLLYATHKREEALKEIQRLKVEGTLRPNTSIGDKANLTEHGTLHIKNISLPVKHDFVRSLALEDKSHHFVCLAKCQGIVLATSVASVANPRDLKEQAVRFTSSLTLNDLPTNFRVTLEVYTLSCRREMIPHEVKYHISKKEGSKRMTPKKQKQDSHLLRPPVQSPAGPGAVRTSQFSLHGYVIFSLREIQRKTFTLNKVPYNSSLQGTVQLQLDCDLSIDIKYENFLTMYEKIGETGAWLRRWCMLNGDTISYWAYPSQRTAGEIPIGSIDLKVCVTKEVKPVPSIECQRPNTFSLDTWRPAHPDDNFSAIMTCKGDKTYIRHLLSADSKDECKEWCEKLNKILTVIRDWSKKGDC